MPRYQLLSCDIALAGDTLNVVHRGPTEPITYPELLLLQIAHGRDSITNVLVCGHLESDEDTERARLGTIYGTGLIKDAYPGAAFRLPEGDTRLGKSKHLCPWSVEAKAAAVLPPEDTPPPAPAATLGDVFAGEDPAEPEPAPAPAPKSLRETMARAARTKPAPLPGE